MTEKSNRSSQLPSGSSRSSHHHLLGIAAALLAAIVSGPAGTMATADGSQIQTQRSEATTVSAEQHRRELFEQRQQAWIARTGRSADTASQAWRWPAQESGLIVRAANAQSR